MRDYLVFSKRERNGTAVLVLLLAGLMLVNVFANRSPALPSGNFGKFSSLMAQWKASAAPKKNSRPDSAADDHFPSPSATAGEHSIYDKKELFYFNPNGLAAEDWVRLGLSKGQAQVVKNYEQRFGKFRSKEDVKKLYVVSPALYAKLEPYIVIPDEPGVAAVRPKKQPVMVELNAADSAQLVTISGIGPAFARRILSYRARLGGFHTPEQLLEVFGFDQDRFDQVQASVRVDSTLIQPMSINTATVETLKKHPYITWNIANAIVSYRKLHGPFASLADLRRIDLVNAEIYRKLAPYFTL